MTPFAEGFIGPRTKLPNEPGRPSRDLLGQAALGQDDFSPRPPELVPGPRRFFPSSGKQAALIGFFLVSIVFSSTSVQKGYCMEAWISGTKSCVGQTAFFFY